MTNLGRWAPWYSHGVEPLPYGSTETYGLAADFLRGLAVEDWGCGYGWFARLHDGPYLGVDGTAGYADVVADLTSRVSPTPGLLLRHVLEHDLHWRTILANAVASARQRLVVVVFTPDGDGRPIDWVDELGVPDLALPHDDIDAALRGWDVARDTLATETAYGHETIWRASWPGQASASSRTGRRSRSPASRSTSSAPPRWSSTATRT